MEKINLPKISEEIVDKDHSRFVIEPLFPGYGATIGNALRRVLLSSITGAAATSFKIEGVSHEFTSIPHAKQDVVEVMMNLKNVYFKSHSDEPVVLEISKKGPAEVTAKDFKANSNVEIMNPDAPIITLDKSADFYMEVVVEKGRGFRTTSVATSEKNEIGRISVDSLFSPVLRVAMSNENTRVGQMTNFDKLILDVITNGSIAPADALKEASAVLVDHYNAIITGGPIETESGDEDEAAALDEIDEVSEGGIDNKTKIEDLELSSRTVNALINAGIKTVGGLKRLSALKLEEIKGLGKKGIDEINTLLG
jgi:DNA-directed RNA polymerase subunit alpha